MKKTKNYFRILIPAAMIAAGILTGVLGEMHMPTQERARQRVEAFAQAVNYEYENPEQIYGYLTEELRQQMTEEEFADAFATERTYPYLSPLFIYYESMELADDQKSGVATFVQAARLPGMTYEVPFVYEHGDYYMDVFHEYADGSYLEKFRILEQQSDWVDRIFSKENSLVD